MPPKFDRPRLSLQLPINLVRIVETTVLLRLTNSVFQLETFSLLSYRCYRSPPSFVTTAGRFGTHYRDYHPTPSDQSHLCWWAASRTAMLPKFDRPRLSLQLPIDLVRIVETTVLLRLTNSIFQLETFSLLSYRCYRSPPSFATIAGGFGTYCRDYHPTPSDQSHLCWWTVSRTAMPPKFDRPRLSLQLPIDLVRIVETTVLLRLTNSIFQLETFHCYHTAVIDHHRHSLQPPVGLVRTVETNISFFVGGPFHDYRAGDIDRPSLSLQLSIDLVRTVETTTPLGLTNSIFQLGTFSLLPYRRHRSLPPFTATAGGLGACRRDYYPATSDQSQLPVDSCFIVIMSPRPIVSVFSCNC